MRAGSDNKHAVTVTVNGRTTEHTSLKAGFLHYSLPISKHIRFRGEVKAAGSATFEHNGTQFVFALAE